MFFLCKNNNNANENIFEILNFYPVQCGLKKNKTLLGIDNKILS